MKQMAMLEDFEYDVSLAIGFILAVSSTAIMIAALILAVIIAFHSTDQVLIPPEAIYVAQPILVDDCPVVKN